MSETASKVRVNLLGRQYNLRGDLDADYMQSLAAKVNDKIEELRKVSPGADALQLAILSALNFADEAEQNRHSGVIDHGDGVVLEEKTRNLISMLEKGIIGEEV